MVKERAAKKPIEPAFVCSFCGADHHRAKKLISGPKVFICDECVGLCVDILAGEKAKGLKLSGERLDMAAALREELDTARDSERRLKDALRTAGAAIAGALGRLVTIRCMWCDVELDTESAAREHVAACPKHPAVIKLAGLEGGRV